MPGYSPFSTQNPYLTMPPQQQQQQQGMDPLQGLNMYQQFSGAGGAAAGAEGLGGGMAQIGGEGALFSDMGGAAGGGEGMAAAGPWALLAAAILANESEAKKGGRRSEDESTHYKDMLTGEVLNQDAEYYGDKVGGIGGKMIKWGAKLGSPLSWF